MDFTAEATEGRRVRGEIRVVQEASRMARLRREEKNSHPFAKLAKEWGTRRKCGLGWQSF
jgi:hypothetical protein